MSKFFKVKISEELLNKLRSGAFLIYCKGPNEQGDDAFKRNAWDLLAEQLPNFDASTSVEILGEVGTKVVLERGVPIEVYDAESLFYF